MLWGYWCAFLPGWLSYVLHGWLASLPSLPGQVVLEAVLSSSEIRWLAYLCGGVSRMGPWPNLIELLIKLSHWLRCALALSHWWGSLLRSNLYLVGFSFFHWRNYRLRGTLLVQCCVGLKEGGCSQSKTVPLSTGM